MIRINAALDHIHILLRRHPGISTSELVAHIKRASSIWINQNGLMPKFVGWSREYAAMSVSYYEVDTIRNYIINQKEHHKKIDFIQEYRTYLPDDERDSFTEDFFDQ